MSDPKPLDEMFRDPWLFQDPWTGEQLSTDNLYVRKFAPDTKQEDLHKIFSKFGNVRSILGPIKSSSNTAAHAFVSYFKSEEALKAYQFLRRSKLFVRFGRCPPEYREKHRKRALKLIQKFSAKNGHESYCSNMKTTIDDKQYIWESSAGGSFTIRPDSGEPMGRGTKIVPHMKEDQVKFLEEKKVKEIVKKHSQFIGYPIRPLVQKDRSKEVSDDEADEEKKEGDEEKKEDEPEIEDVGSDDEADKNSADDEKMADKNPTDEVGEDEASKTAKEEESQSKETSSGSYITEDWTIVSGADDEYSSDSDEGNKDTKESGDKKQGKSEEKFLSILKLVSIETSDSLSDKIEVSFRTKEEYLNSLGVNKYGVDQNLLDEKIIALIKGGYKTLIYEIETLIKYGSGKLKIPLEARTNFFTMIRSGLENVKRSLLNCGFILRIYQKLPIRSAQFPEPPSSNKGEENLSFIFSFVTSTNLQVSKILEALHVDISFDEIFDKILKTLRRLELEAWGTYEWIVTEYDCADKFEGAFNTLTNKLADKDTDSTVKKLARYLRYYTSTSGDDFCSFGDLVSRMKENQKNIYYITGESKEVIDASAFVERLKKRGFEVVYITQPIEEYVIEKLNNKYEGKNLLNLTEANCKAEKLNEQIRNRIKRLGEIMSDKN